MNIGSGVVLRAALFAAAAGLLWIGLSFLVYGLYLTLIPSVGAGGAAFATAGISIAVGASVLTVLFMRTQTATVEHPVPVQATVVEGGSMIKALSELAREHPFIAIGVAAILGAANGAADNVKRR